MSSKIGIPRALMYHYYYPMWKVFFNELGFKVKLSPNTNKKIVDQGVKIAVDDICLPFKVYYGHVIELIGEVDYIFVPRFVSLGNCNYVCPKFMGLPDMLKAGIKDLPELIEPVIDLRKGFMPVRSIAAKIGKKLNKGFWQVEKAYRKAVKVQNEFVEIQTDGRTTADAMEIVLGKKKKEQSDNLKEMNIVVIGHSYIINDKYVSMNLEKRLREMGARVYTVEMFGHKLLEKAAAEQNKRVFWYFNRKVMGAAYYVFSNKEKIDGIIQVTAFGCGPDSMVKELIDIKGKRENMSILNINIDEHSGDAGLITRLEAFVDLIERRKFA